MDLVVPRLPRRNVEVYNSEKAVIAGFWQYGTLQWDEFYRYLTTFIVTQTAWAIFQYDPTQNQHGAQCHSGPEIVQPGEYILLSDTGQRTRVGLEYLRSRPRHPTHSNTPARESYYRIRGRARDGKCLITGLQTQTYSRLQVAHIFPRTHDVEWIDKGYPSKITDTADVGVLGGSSKIDSLQNLITLRSDLRDAWDNYEFGVDPDNNYRIISFTNGNADINGLHLQLDHIHNPTQQPLRELFIDHLMQGLFKHMKGSAEPVWTYEDFDDAFDGGSINLSKLDIWGAGEGKELFELALADRLHLTRMSQSVQCVL
ncbi:hypothetical protein BJ322DRAFT_1060327 [Thelephora terrestris]|uniref:HNH nuclease domain-containing protein n=1 Tax=Thelephora terrestris TaxID=56493 RepID=A0A9P6HDI8_9AGAM|nr:hypothetical protein BJ322DRAFT_1060327 [Thelephora terrestris]